MKVSDDVLVAALMSTSTNREAALSVKLTEAQLYSRMKRPELREKLQQAKARALEAATAAAQGRALEAVDVLAAVMRDRTTAAQVRVNAADAVLRNTMRLTEAVDVLGRLEALESAQRAEDV